MLKERAFGARIGTACSAIAEMIAKREFVLKEQDLALIEGRGAPELTGWVFAYRASCVDGAERMQLLMAGATSPEPRVREQVCDLIGDLALAELREVLVSLSSDPVSYVAEAARSNLKMLAA